MSNTTPDIRYKFLDKFLNTKNIIPLGNNIEEMEQEMNKFLIENNITNINFIVEKVYNKDNFMFSNNKNHLYLDNAYAIYFTDITNEKLSRNIKIESYFKTKHRWISYETIKSVENFVFYIGEQYSLNNIFEYNISDEYYDIDRKLSLKDAIITHYNIMCVKDLYNRLYYYTHCFRKKIWSYRTYVNKIKLFRLFIKKYKNLKFASSDIYIIQYVLYYINKNFSISDILEQMKEDNIIKHYEKK